MQKIKIRFAYKSGFRRLWIVLSAIWILIGVWFHIYDRVSWSDIFGYFILPIVLSYLIGVALVWVVEGFAKADK